MAASHIFKVLFVNQGKVYEIYARKVSHGSPKKKGKQETTVNGLVETLPALAQMCSVFPLLTEQAVNLIMEFSPVRSTNGLSFNSGDITLRDALEDAFNAITNHILVND